MICQKIFEQLLRKNNISTQHTVLVVCGGKFERDVSLSIGFTDVTISNLDEQPSSAIAPYKWSRQDAERLDYADNSFDIVLVHAGLHHCYSPHRALLEMYRVARLMVIVIEARDSFSMSVAKRLGLTSDYEIEAVSSENFESGGVANGPIPNFIYRWTENEVLKTIKSFEPRYAPRILFFYGLRLPYDRFRYTSQLFLRGLLSLVGPIAELFAKVFPRQGNEFGFVIFKGGRLQQWLHQQDDGRIVISKESVAAMGRAWKSI